MAHALCAAVAPIGKNTLAILRVDRHAPARAQRLFETQPRDLLISRVGIDATALCIGDEDAQRGSVTHCAEARLTVLQRVPGSLALDKVTQGARQPMSVEMVFDEIVMCAALHGLARGFFIARRAQDQDQGIRCGLEHLIEHLKALAVGKREIEQDHLDTFPVQAFECIGEPRHPFDMKRAVSRCPASASWISLASAGSSSTRSTVVRGIVHGKSVHCDMPIAIIPLAGGIGHKYLLHRGGMSRDRHHTNALVITAIVVIVTVVIVLVPVMIIIVHVTPVILAITMNFLVTRNVIAVVPVVLHKEDSLAAGIVLAAVLAPVFGLTWRYTQINRRAIRRYLLDCYRMTINDLRLRIVTEVEATIVVGLANAGVTLVIARECRGGGGGQGCRE